MFKIIVVAGPAENYIERCLQSILDQKEEFKVQVVLDPFGDKTYEQAKKYECDNIKVILNDKVNRALCNTVKGIQLLDCSDEDIIASIDGDDWLYSNQPLSIVKKHYDSNPNLLLTYGSWVGYPDEKCSTNCYPYLKEHFEKGLRHYDWRGTHLKTFKYKIWKHVKDQDLKDTQGIYFSTSWDMAMMWPMMEMAGYHRILYIPEPLYIYNKEGPYNDFKLRLKEQMFYADYIAAMKPYGFKESF
jgi:glycosyltransferase involved in cell wall biosynthesis